MRAARHLELIAALHATALELGELRLRGVGRLELGDDWINANIREKHKAQKRREPPWPRDEWWRRVEASIRTYASWPAQELGVVSHGESTLLNTWEQSEGGTSMEDALRGLSSAR